MRPPTTGSDSGAEDSMRGSSVAIDKVLAALSEMIEALGCAMGGERETAEEILRHASAILLRGTDAVNAVPETVAFAEDASRCVLRGNLAPWQIRRLTTHIDSNLSDSIRCEDLARLVRLSLSHFIRAFKASFGHTPHTFIMRRRFERAQGLMLATDASLGDIALECGLADQSHLSRIFQRFVAESPGAWRRARADRRSDGDGNIAAKCVPLRNLPSTGGARLGVERSLPLQRRSRMIGMQRGSGISPDV
jgi:AraC family transcriptional regulator